MRSRRSLRARAALAGLMVSFSTLPAAAGTVEARIFDTKGKPVEGAVLLAYAGAGARSGPVVVDVDQKNKEFVPRISAVSVGTQIRFPNHDQIRHHVYSFSPAKNFEIPLYKGVPAEPIVFDKPGVVTLGCNIHDWMQGYVLVTDATRFALSHAGGAVKLEGLPSGTVRLQVWHPDSKVAPEKTEQSIEVGSTGTQSVTFEIDRKKAWKARRGGGRGGDRYR